MIYLDHNATTPLDDEVKKAMVAAFEVFGNPSSSHYAGAAARDVVENARRQAAGLIGCDPVEIIFTSGGTEANNLAIIGIAGKFQTGHIITSAIEHPSVLNPIKWLEQKGFTVTYLNPDTGGRVSPDDLRKALKKETVLITVMHSNNETGVLQPIKEIGGIAREYGVLFHSDAAQSAGKMEVKVSGLPVDMLTIAPHKFYGPKGIGALYIKYSGEGSRNPSPIMFGAGHEMGLRPGTENVVCIAGFGKACNAAAVRMTMGHDHTLALRDRLYGLLREKLRVKINGHKALRLPNTLNISIEDIIAEDIIMKLKDKIALSTGSACHSGIKKPSPVLKAMGLSDREVFSSIRISLGKDNTADEIERAAEMIIGCAKAL